MTKLSIAVKLVHVDFSPGTLRQGGMRMRKSATALAILVAATGCSRSVGDSWVGLYDVDLVQDAWECGTAGEPSTQTGSTTWEIVEDSSGLYADTLCRTSLFDVSERRASIEPTSCNGIADDGRPYDTEITGGFLMRDEDGFYGQMNAVLTFDDGLCITVEVEILATER